MLLPFFFLSAVAGLLTMLEQKYHVGAVGSAYDIALSERITLAGLIPWFYLGKLLFPMDLNFIYPRWTPGDLLLPGLLGVMAIFLLIALLVVMARRSPAAAATLFSFSCFLAGLFPVLGLFDAYFFRYSYVSDHFQYLASMAPAALAGAALSSLPSKGNHPRLSMAIRSSVPVILLAFVLLDWRGSLRFRDSETLWRETLRLNPPCGIANHNLATELMNLGRTSEAIDEFQKILSRNPADAGALNNLGVIKLKSGNPNGAKIFFEEVLKSSPHDPAALCNLGETLILSGDHTAAERYLRQSVEVDGNSHAATLLCVLLRGKGDIDGALRIGQAAIGSNPSDPQAWLAMALALRDSGDMASAISALRTGVQLAPEDGQLVNALSAILLDAGNEIEGQELMERHLLSHRDDPDTLLNLALLRMKQTRNDEAISLLQELVLSDPSNARAHDLLADALRRMRRNEEAALELQRALAIDGSNPRLLQNLASIQAELGMKDIALQTARKGLKEAQAQGERSIANSLLLLIRSLKR
jgi:tetratricopeptide (TPR) repeat protein